MEIDDDEPINRTRSVAMIRSPATEQQLARGHAHLQASALQEHLEMVPECAAEEARAEEHADGEGASGDGEDSMQDEDDEPPPPYAEADPQEADAQEPRPMQLRSGAAIAPQAQARRGRRHQPSRSRTPRTHRNSQPDWTMIVQLMGADNSMTIPYKPQAGWDALTT